MFTKDQGLTETQTVCKVQREPVQTVGNYLDDRIEESRKRTEQLCILKARAEAAGFLNYPHQDLSNIVNAYPF